MFSVLAKNPACLYMKGAQVVQGVEVVCPTPLAANMRRDSQKIDTVHMITVDTSGSQFIVCNASGNAIGPAVSGFIRTRLLHQSTGSSFGTDGGGDGRSRWITGEGFLFTWSSLPRFDPGRLLRRQVEVGHQGLYEGQAD